MIDWSEEVEVRRIGLGLDPTLYLRRVSLGTSSNLCNGTNLGQILSTPNNEKDFHSGRPFYSFP
jgi:hypothetical protein